MRHLKVGRLVVKIGTNTICDTDGNVDRRYVDEVARQVIELESKGVQTIVVTSGAIGSGSSELGLNGKNKDIAMKQACAAVGQATLMMAYRDAFMKHGKCVGQLLLTYGAFSDRRRYIDLKRAMDEMFRLGAVPIVNENDVISTDEIEEVFGDNDKLSALVASKMDADLLILLTDVDGLYDRNPETDSDARLITTVDEITRDIERIAGSSRNERSVGGMRTKISAAKIAMQSGCNMVIANGRLDDVVLRVAGGEEVGTLFTAQARYTNKERWILFASPRGKITIDAGAEKALREGGSLLPCGIVAVEGKFRKGDVVRIGRYAKGVANVSSTGVLSLMKESHRDRSHKHAKVSGDKVVISSENVVFVS